MEDAEKIQRAQNPEGAGLQLLALTSEGWHEVSQSDTEVVFLGGLKNRVKQLGERGQGKGSGL